MKHINFLAIGALLAAAPVASLLAAPLSSAQLTAPGTSRTLQLPSAADRSPVISLGNAIDPQGGEIVEGYAIIHFRNASKTDARAQKRGPACYGYLARDAKWKVIEPWVLNATNTRGLDAGFLLENMSADIAKWEDATDGVLNGSGTDVLGDGLLTTDLLVADTVAPDGLNEVYFSDIADSNAIAVTTIWGVFRGPTQNRKLVEWDQAYDDVDYDWSAAGEAGKMDFENIATHELGHSVGMADLYDSACSTETMYGYASFGEILKRDLNSGDIRGMNELY